jgi:hypothetical protein
MFLAPSRAGSLYPHGGPVGRGDRDAKDLRTLEDYLNSKRIDYRVFTSNVILKGAKWSREQKN